MGFMLIHDLINPETGNTYKEDNLKLSHNIPLGALVEVNFSRWFGEGACAVIHARLWVVHHDRDCDGTPLYGLSIWREPALGRWKDYWGGFAESKLKAIPLTPEVISGEDALELMED